MNVSIPAAAAPGRPARVVVLVSGSGTNLQALLDATRDADYGVQIVAVGADRGNIEALARAERSDVPTFVRRVGDFSDRAEWDAALGEAVVAYEPDWVVLAGFMKLVSTDFLARFPGRVLNTHPALCPSFPGTCGAADALAYGVKVTGATLFVVDGGVDTGPIVAQVAVPVLDDDSVAVLNERIKGGEQQMLVEHVGRLARAGYSLTGRRVTLG